ncbi:hypothetical protein AMATHDRAFT_6434 [Amanita thiersii Skay4041]|uniref:FAD-binding PCMH-type domain-containing protein n=1 Tax=Amanita thiersii Skay4041 TaxID=703135 RepID=A0A2A9NJ25_9AGAR|nr:hypothetical protein AMATHDRAFT_6434 [Amanita thiersii Skay4041]
MSNVPNLKIQGTVLTPSSPSYTSAIARPSATSVLQPAYVIFPATPADIPPILHFARSHTPLLEIAIKGGGCHTTTASSSEGGIVIDLGHIKHVKVSEDRKTVSVGGGALWGDVFSELEKQELVVVGGNIWSVGVGGFTTGGGSSYLTGSFGLAIDNLIAATVVLADGRIVRCSNDQEPDLFWAIRGAGHQFGVVVEFEFKAYPARGPALVGVLAYPGTELPAVLKAMKEFLPTQPLTTRFILGFSRAPPDFYPSLIILPYVESPTIEQAEQILSPFLITVQPIFRQTFLVPTFHAVTHSADEMLAHLPPRSIMGGALFSDLWEDVVQDTFNDWVSWTQDANGERNASIVLWEFDRRDKIAEVKKEETAFAARDPWYYVVATSRHVSPDTDADARRWVSGIQNRVKKANVERAGVTFPTPSNHALGHEDMSEVYGENYARLRKLKAKYDPGKVWSKGCFIEPNFE